MSRVRDLLYRFRPAGSPGPASGAGVPSDRGAGMAAELRDLFDELERAERAGTDVVEEARTEAAAELARADAAARAIVAAAEERAAGERSSAAARYEQALAGEAAVEISKAEASAEWIRGRAARRSADAVDRILAGVESLLGDSLPGGPT